MDNEHFLACSVFYEQVTSRIFGSFLILNPQQKFVFWHPTHQKTNKTDSGNRWYITSIIRNFQRLIQKEKSWLNNFMTISDKTRENFFIFLSLYLYLLGP